MEELTQPGRPLSLSLSLKCLVTWHHLRTTLISDISFPKAILTLTLLLLRKPNKQMTEKKRELQRDGQKSQWTSNPSFNSFLWLVVGPFFFFYFSFTLPECCVGMITTIDEQSMRVTSMGLAHCVSQAAKQLS